MPWLSCIISNVVLATLVALAAWFVQRRLRRPGIARILWLIVLVKLVTPPLVSLPLRESPGMMSCLLGTCGCALHAGRQTVLFSTLPWILLAVWSAGAAATGWNAWRRWTQFRRLIAHAVPAPREWQTLAARLASELSLRSPPEILAVPGRLPPLVVPGRRRARLLLPAALIGRLNASQRAALLLHELTHIKRRDHVVRMLELTVRVAYWWLPLVGSIGRQLRACEETCCDAAVVAHLPQARRDYARLLLDVVDFASPLPRQAIPHATAMSAADDLEQRLHTILGASSAKRRTWPAAAFALGLSCAILPCGWHYDSISRPAAATAADKCEPSGDAMRMPGERKYDLSLHCCPS